MSRPRQMPRKLKRETELDYAEKCLRLGIRYPSVKPKKERDSE